MVFILKPLILQFLIFQFKKMKLYPIETGNFKLDGAMFGVVPKTIWSRTNPADENNLIDIAARCLLIEDGNRLILIDTGMGNKQSEKVLAIIHCGVTSMDKSLVSTVFIVMMLPMYLRICILIIVVEVCSGMQKKTGYEPAFKTLNSGVMKAIGNGQQNRTLGRKHLSFRKHSDARKRDS
jgi:hypothetical protein